MTEDEARDWIAMRFGAEAVTRLEQYVALLTDEGQRQNLIAPSTSSQIWTRHLLDSAQLAPLAPAQGSWLDIGSGAGLPGLIVAVLRQEETILVEPRRQRAAFLERCVSALGLRHVRVEPVKVQQLRLPSLVISARAVASVENLLQAAAACATTQTRWLLPRGRSAASEVDALRRCWKGMFHMKQSLTDPTSSILVCDGIEQK